jgi:hypothetical protein
MQTRRQLGLMLASSGLVVGRRDAYGFSNTALDDESVSSAQQMTVPDITGNEHLPYFGQFYGGLPFGHGVGNTNLSVGSELGVSNFFYADRTGVISHFRYQKRWGKGYSHGTFGEYTVRIVEADEETKLPVIGGRIISQIKGYVPTFEQGQGQRFHTVAFREQGMVEARQPYCLVWINTHPRPDRHYFAQNNDIQFQWVPPDRAIGNAPAEGFWNPARLTIGGQNRPWFRYPITASNGRLRWGRCGPPLIEFRYSDGQWSGWGSWGSPFTVEGYIAGFDEIEHVRERFRVTRASRAVKSVWLNLWRLNGGTGDLVVSLERGPDHLSRGNGAIIEEVVISAREIHDAGSSFGRDSNQPGPDLVPWIEAAFATTHNLELGNIYSVRLRTTGGTMQTTSGARAEQQGLSPRHDDFITHERQRRLSWLTFDDSMGMQRSVDDGQRWAWWGNRRQMPCLFECVQETS